MSESTRDQRMTPGLAPVAFVDLTVPRATEAGKSAKEGEAIQDKGKGKAEEGQDTYGERGSSGRGGGRGAGADARTAGAPPFASTTERGRSARTAGAPPSASTTDTGAGARTAGASTTK
jgi:hypothetical protein